MSVLLDGWEMRAKKWKEEYPLLKSAFRLRSFEAKEEDVFVCDLGW